MKAIDNFSFHIYITSYKYKGVGEGGILESYANPHKLGWTFQDAQTVTKLQLNLL